MLHLLFRVWILTTSIQIVVYLKCFSFSEHICFYFLKKFLDSFEFYYLLFSLLCNPLNERKSYSSQELHVMTIFSNNYYWIRGSKIWRILQIKEVVIDRGRSPRWITPPKIYRILHTCILGKPNSIITLLLYHSLFLKEFCHFALCFSVHQK